MGQDVSGSQARCCPFTSKHAEALQKQGYELALPLYSGLREHVSQMHSSRRRADVEIIAAIVERLAFHQQGTDPGFAGSQAVELTQSSFGGWQGTRRIKDKNQNSEIIGAQR